MDFKLILAIAFASVPAIIWIYFLITNFKNKKEFNSALINGLILIAILGIYYCSVKFTE